jgi:hypothetical protein
VRENLLASLRQSGQKQDISPASLNHNATYGQRLSPYRDFANSISIAASSASGTIARWR